MQATLRRIKEALRRRMHEPIPEQGAWLKQVVRGFFAYHAVPTNGSALRAFYYYVKRIWLRTLRRRSQKHRFSWQRIAGSPPTGSPNRASSTPGLNQRFAVKHPRWEPDAGCERKAGMSLPVKVWSVQSRAGRTGASLAGVAATRGPKRRQRLDGVWN